MAIYGVITALNEKGGEITDTTGYIWEFDYKSNKKIEPETIKLYDRVRAGRFAIGINEGRRDVLYNITMQEGE